ncbi:MAG: hypothetical protein ACFFAU_10260 [Candidatus Hodarchaeota archaeon]
MGTPIIAYLTTDFSITEGFLDYFLSYTIFIFIIFLVFYILNYFHQEYKNMLISFKNSNILEQNGYDTLKKEKGLNLIRIIVSGFIIFYLFIRGVTLEWLELTQFDSSNYTGIVPINLQVGYVGIVFGRFCVTLLYLAVLPDIFSALVGTLYLNMKKIAIKIKLTTFHEDGCWGVSQIGKFVLKICIFGFLIVTIIDLSLLYSSFIILTTEGEIDPYNIFLSLFWGVGSWFFVILLFIVPQFPIRREIGLKKSQKLRIYYQKLNKIEENLSKTETDISDDKTLNVLSLMSIISQIERNTNWPFNM